MYCVVYAWNLLAGPSRRLLLNSYSQAGEDRLIDHLLGRPNDGFYVDVGAHHPDRLSNTRRFYQRGWQGINIEPNPDWCRVFEARRPRDTNLNLGVAAAENVLTYREMDARALSTFSGDAAQQAVSMGAKTLRISEVPVMPLSAILAEHAPDLVIDFMSIDTEGFDLEVLESNDWKRWRPQVICIEAVSETDVRNEPVLRQHDAFFARLGYERRATTRLYGRVLNAIYRDVRLGTLNAERSAVGSLEL